MIGGGAGSTTSGASGVYARKQKHLLLTVRVPSEDLSYPIRVGDGVLTLLGREVVRETSAKRVAIITDTNVGPLYAATAERSLREQGLEVVVRTLPAGERTKNPDDLVALVKALLDAGLSRRDLVVTLGGGVIGDLGGLAAALFMRGIDVVQCPTSLLAQVDASVGGKVAVDLGVGKNLLGAFHFPRFVIIDTAVLATLSDRDLSCGLAEMVKHALLFDAEHLQQLLQACDAMYAREPKLLARLVAHSVALKAACVSRDPLEKSGGGKGRVLLNLGHTVGHAIEHASGYALQHGEAIALGLRAAARVSEMQGLAAGGFETKIADILEAMRLPNDLDVWLAGERGRTLAAALAHDKKRSGGKLTFIGLADVGEPSTLSLGVDEILSLLRGDKAR